MLQFILHHKRDTVKKCVIFCGVLIVLCTITGCYNSAVKDLESAETGFPAEQINREMIYYDGKVWGLDFYATELQRLSFLPDGYEYVGVTIENNPYEVPRQNFHTAHLSIGMEVYANPDNPDDIYIKGYWNGELFGRFVVIDTSHYVN